MSSSKVIGVSHGVTSGSPGQNIGSESFTNGRNLYHIFIVKFLTKQIKSICGYNSEVCQKKSKSTYAEDWSRRTAYDFTGCCAHANITYNESTGNIKRVIGFFDHNDQCKAQKLMRIPSIPLHEHVYEVALAQLSQGARYGRFFSIAVTRSLIV